MKETKISKGINPDAKMIRQKVFIEEQGFIGEFDEIDKISFHTVIYSDGIPAGTGRVFQKENSTYTIGRVAVIKDFRKNGIGERIMSSLENEAKKLGAAEIELSAQLSAQNFYSRLGYMQKGSTYFDEHVEHIKMIKSL